MPTGKKADPPDPLPPKDLPGKLDCPVCNGVGYYRNDVDVTHPDFGKLTVCTCRQGDISQHKHSRLFAMSNLDELSHLTFENFNPKGYIGLGPIEGQSLETAYEAANHFAHTLDGWLILQGTYGCGKTHLAAAIANFVVDLNIQTLFITVPDILDSLRFSYDDPTSTFEQRFDEIRNVPLLILDDFGTQNATEWAQEKLFQIMNYRYVNKLPIVLTTNVDIRTIEPRILSRLSDEKFVQRLKILAPDYRRPNQGTPGPLPNLHNFTFENFSLRTNESLHSDHVNSLKKALEDAQEFANDPDGWLVITGPYGSGKTHLAAAIANYQAGRGYNLPKFVVIPDLMDHLRSTFGPNSSVSLDILFEDVKTAHLLILDDLGTQNMTSWTREKLYQLFNYRYNAELPTVITTPELRDEMDPRILSRLQDKRLCKMSAITAPSFRGTPRSKRRKKR